MTPTERGTLLEHLIAVLERDGVPTEGHVIHAVVVLLEHVPDRARADALDEHRGEVREGALRDDLVSVVALELAVGVEREKAIAARDAGEPAVHVLAHHHQLVGGRRDANA